MKVHPDWGKAFQLLPDLRTDPARTLEYILAQVLLHIRGYQMGDLNSSTAEYTKLLIRIQKTPLGRTIVHILTSNPSAQLEFPSQMFEISGLLNKLREREIVIQASEISASIRGLIQSPEDERS